MIRLEAEKRHKNSGGRVGSREDGRSQDSVHKTGSRGWRNQREVTGAEGDSHKTETGAPGTTELRLPRHDKHLRKIRESYPCVFCMCFE